MAVDEDAMEVESTGTDDLAGVEEDNVETGSWKGSSKSSSVRGEEGCESGTSA